METKLVVKKTLMILMFGFALIGIAYAQSNNLEGTWVTDISVYTTAGSLLEMTFTNGVVKTSMDGVPFTKGTYTIIDNGMLKTQTSSVYGKRLHIQSKWYSKNELKTALMPIYMRAMSESYANQLIDNMFMPEVDFFSVSGDTLTMRKKGETISLTYTRKEN